MFLRQVPEQCYLFILFLPGQLLYYLQKPTKGLLKEKQVGLPFALEFWQELLVNINWFSSTEVAHSPHSEYLVFILSEVQ